MDLVNLLREAGAVTRLHTVPHLQHYDVAQHCWRMAVLLYALHPGPSRRLLWAVLLHDVGERFTGDIPTTIKWASPDIDKAFDKMEAEISKRLGLDVRFQADERNWLKGLDLFELYLYCQDEIAMGNQHIVQVRDECWSILTRHQEVPREIREWMQRNKEWKRSNNRWILEE